MRCHADECAFEFLAEQLANGEGYLPFQGHLWAPGFIFFLAAHKLLFPAGMVIAAKVTQVLISAATQMLLVSEVRLAFGNRVAAGTSLWVALEPTLLAFTHYLWTETIYIFLLVLAAKLSLHLARSAGAGRGRWFGTGAVWGLCTLTKPLPLYFLPIVLIGLVWHLKARGQSTSSLLGKCGILSIAFCCAVGPWTARNYLAYGSFAPVDATAGLNLWRGNNPDPPPNWDFGPQRKIAPHPECPEDNVIARDECMRAKAYEFIASNPGLFLRRSVTKMADFWSPNSFLVRHLAFRKYGPLPTPFVLIFAAAAVLSSALILLGAPIGAALAGHGESGDAGRLAYLRFVLALVAFYTIVHAVVSGMSRFRLPIMPFLIPLAVLAWVGREHIAGLRRCRRCVLAAGGVLLVLIFLWSVTAAEFVRWRIQRRDVQAASPAHHSVLVVQPVQPRPQASLRSPQVEAAAR